MELHSFGAQPQGAILLVEDEAPVRETIKNLLEGYGYPVLQAESGHEALFCLTQSDLPVAVVLTDFNLPGMNGLELADKLRNMNPNMPILFMSGDRSNFEGAVDSCDTFSKPLKVDQLMTRIRDLMEQGQPATPANIPCPK